MGLRQATVIGMDRYELRFLSRLNIIREHELKACFDMLSEAVGLSTYLSQ